MTPRGGERRSLYRAALYTTHVRLTWTVLPISMTREASKAFVGELQPPAQSSGESVLAGRGPTGPRARARAAAPPRRRAPTHRAARRTWRRLKSASLT